MVKTEKSQIYHHVKILSYKHNINLYQFKRYKKGSKTYWKKVLFQLKVEMLERLYVKREVLKKLPWCIELNILKY